MDGSTYFSPKLRYQEKHDSSVIERDRIRKLISLVGNLRLLTVAAGIAAVFIGYRAGFYGVIAGGVVSGMLLFVYLAIRHGVLFRKLDEYNALIDINRRGGDRWTDAWRKFTETGDAFTDHEHPYTSDLDIFGQGSLYQFCCCARTFYGKLRLAELFKFRDGDEASIIARQQAVENLAEHFTWRQRLECAGFQSAIAGDPHDLIAWAESGNRTPLRLNGWRLLSWLPVGAAVAALAGWLAAGTVFFAVPVIAVQVAIVVFTSRKNFRLFNAFDKYRKALVPFSECIGHIERQPFTASYLQERRNDITDGNEGVCASTALGQLARIIDAAEARLSPLPWLLANVLLLWDLRCRFRLDRWKERHGRRVRSWLSCIGEFEALSSLALLRYDHADWVFPKFIEETAGLCVRAKALGHPLLRKDQRVANDFSLGPPDGSVGIITGSNMSGKSTFLRSIGCNLVLAYAGGPVCAASFTVSFFALYTSMRAGDDLLSHTSTFYAELLRIRKIVDAAKRGQTLLFLLDELFSGTNSTDRHDGAVTLLRELAKPHTLGLISTHDLALCSLADREDTYTNHHFRETYVDDDLHFDYTLRDGPSTTRNALFLMRKAGIDVGGNTIK
ncbi:MAG: hypothetical protein JW863_14870 [Chitinispirillaceae bacterium]|nr:hypothetical protein [Chitinispirillaceae bacterium]